MKQAFGFPETLPPGFLGPGVAEGQVETGAPLRTGPEGMDLLAQQGGHSSSFQNLPDMTPIIPQYMYIYNKLQHVMKTTCQYSITSNYHQLSSKF